MSKITALEYFGYNCQTYMKHKDFLFQDDSEVGVYLQIPIYTGSIDDKPVLWADVLNNLKHNLYPLYEVNY